VLDYGGQMCRWISSDGEIEEERYESSWWALCCGPFLFVQLYQEAMHCLGKNVILIFTVTCNLEVVSRECQFASRLLKHMVGFQNEGAVKVAAKEQCGNRMKFAAFIDNPEQKICFHCQKLRAGRIETHIDRCSCLLDFGTQFE
jgi:hypothetical protein